ncbi:MAG: anhydro-N-acetylmuramic acid kinase [Acidobacteria bacterium]|nr:anhydro-N-acetylmuramic acid kinase [Acidobacteriota bacterium]
MIVAGVMSGTSVDGIDVSLVRINRSSARALPALELLGHQAFPYPADVRRRILVSMNSPRASVADLARLNFLLGELYADAVISTQKKLRTHADLVGCHGQTLYHQGTQADFLGRRLAVTWQTGEASVIAARARLPVVSDFRPADMAHGGKGAPLVPYLDFLLYRDRRIGRIALNLGGIANLTAIPAGASLNQIVAFDTGPGNMVIDALAEELFGQECDLDGKIAASGRVVGEVVVRFLAEVPFFLQKPPRTAGREEFGREFAREFLHASRPLGAARASGFSGAAAIGEAPAIEKRDVIATATALTVRTVADAVRRFVPRKGNFKEMIVSGGGAKNPTLVGWLAEEVRSLGLGLRSSDEFGIPSSAKESVAFAVLAYETWNRRPSSVPAATGAKSPAVLGKICYP